MPRGRLLQPGLGTPGDLHDLAVGQHERGRRPVQHHRLVADRRDLQLGVVRDGQVALGHLARRTLPTRRHAVQRPLARDGDEHRAVGGHHEAPAGADLRRRLQLRLVEGRDAVERQHPQAPVLGVEDRRGAAAGRELRAARGTHGTGERELGGVDGARRRRAVVGQEHAVLLLLHVERRGPGEQRAVEGAGLVVEPAQPPRLGLGHPDAGVVEVDLRRRLAVLCEREGDQGPGEQDDQRPGHDEAGSEPEPLLDRVRHHAPWYRPAS
nr:hypothetical protein GCM10025730_25910 [Promicromonospora thailandica]